MEERYIWVGAGLAVLAFLVVTTPGWQAVLGVENLSLGFDMEKYAPAAILLGFMVALVAAVLIGERGSD